MTAQGPFQVTERFEQTLCEYTGAPYAVAVDSCSSALFLALMRADVRGRDVWIPRRTYPSVPCSIIHAGGRVRWYNDDPEMTAGPYWLGMEGSRHHILDSALRFTSGMYNPGQTQCLSFSGAYKHLKLGKGGAILTDSESDYRWFKRARFSGRNECSYHDDHFDMLGWNCYMHPMIAAQGLLLMGQFLRADGSRAVNADLSFRFPDLSRFPIYTQQVSPAQAQAEAQRAIAAWDAIDFAATDPGTFVSQPYRPCAAPRDHEPAAFVGAQDFTVTPEDAEKIGRGLLADADPTGELADVLRGFVGSDRVTERAGVPMRCVVPPPAEPYQDYDAYRGNP